MYKLTYRVANPLFIITFLLFAAAASVPFANIPAISQYVSLGWMTYFYAIPLWQLGAGLAVAALSSRFDYSRRFGPAISSRRHLLVLFTVIRRPGQYGNGKR